MPDEEREWSLETKKRKPRATAIKVCPACYTAVPSTARTCPCGHVFAAAPEERKITETDGTLKKIEAIQRKERRQEVGRARSVSDLTAIALRTICCGDMITLHEARPFSTGLPIGFPDLFGFRTVEITPEMVGKKLAVFAFIEVKTKQGRTSRAQEKMHAFLRDAGALGGVARSTEEALHLLDPSTEPPEMR